MWLRVRNWQARPPGLRAPARSRAGPPCAFHSSDRAGCGGRRPPVPNRRSKTSVTSRLRSRSLVNAPCDQRDHVVVGAVVLVRGRRSHCVRSAALIPYRTAVGTMIRRRGENQLAATMMKYFSTGGLKPPMWTRRMCTKLLPLISPPRPPADLEAQPP